MTPFQRALRALAQLVASGVLTTLVDKIAGGLDPGTAGAVLAVWMVIVTFVHNFAEEQGWLPPLAKNRPDPAPPSH